jgi:hypothetical protein
VSACERSRGADVFSTNNSPIHLEELDERLLVKGLEVQMYFPIITHHPLGGN